MGLQLGYLLGGSILIETVFSWPGTGFLLNAAIFQRDLPLLQGTILVLAMFFVGLNLLGLTVPLFVVTGVPRVVTVLFVIVAYTATAWFVVLADGERASIRGRLGRVRARLRFAPLS